jgi:hypothetical protein
LKQRHLDLVDKSARGRVPYHHLNEWRKNMHSRTNRILVCAGLVLAIVASTQSARANLLVDPGFEVNPLDTASNVLNFFATYQGIWGVEAATITSAENGVTPAQGVQMLRMVDDGLTTTQGFQVTDVTSYAALIDSGGATVNLSALFNVDKAVPAAVSAVYVQFFSAASYGSQIGSYIGSGLTLDTSPNTWETASISGGIPVGTRWLLSQVAYSDASLVGIDGVGHPGYVDAADLTVVPEPASLGLLVLAAMALRRRPR